jgi:hypothetical protein
MLRLGLSKPSESGMGFLVPLGNASLRRAVFMDEHRKEQSHGIF